MNHNIIKNGFILSGLSNIFGVLVFSKGFTNVAVNNADPIVMSNFGMLLIMLWGVAYMTVANHYTKVVGLVGVFAVEKLVYSSVWLIWLKANDLAQLYETDILAGLFFSLYGLNDLIFMVFFAYVFLKTKKLAQN